jgi:hypothetical protein
MKLLRKDVYKNSDKNFYFDKLAYFGGRVVSEEGYT